MVARDTYFPTVWKIQHYIKTYRISCFLIRSYRIYKIFFAGREREGEGGEREGGRGGEGERERERARGRERKKTNNAEHMVQSLHASLGRRLGRRLGTICVG